MRFGSRVTTHASGLRKCEAAGISEIALSEWYACVGFPDFKQEEDF